MLHSDLFCSQKRIGFLSSYTKYSNYSSDMLHDFNDFLRVNIPSTINTKPYPNKNPRSHPSHRQSNENYNVDAFDAFINKGSRKTRHSKAYTMDLHE